MLTAGGPAATMLTADAATRCAAVASSSRAKTLRPRRRLRRFLALPRWGWASPACPSPDWGPAWRGRPADGLGPPDGGEALDTPTSGAPAPVSWSSTSGPSGAARTGKPDAAGT